MELLANILQVVAVILLFVVVFVVVLVLTMGACIGALQAAQKSIVWLVELFTNLPLTLKLSSTSDIILVGMPEGLSKRTASYYRRILLRATNNLAKKAKNKEVKITVGNKALLLPPVEELAEKDTSQKNENSESSLELRARQYEAKDPLYYFEQLALPRDVEYELLTAIGVVSTEKKVFEEWGLKAIEHFPGKALNFHGLPGTGKTLAAHALAKKLERKILVTNYAEIEGKYVGDGPRNADALFYAATRDNAVLFIDEADTLLSRRLLNVTQAADQALNTLSSQMLICLENFPGIVIFATNIVENYDRAFETRIQNIYFPMPDEDCRRRIWEAHLPSELPLADDVTTERLAAGADDICGREIKKAVLDAANRAALENKTPIELNDLLEAVRRIKKARIPVKGERARPQIDYNRLFVEAKARQSLKIEPGKGTPFGGSSTFPVVISTEPDSTDASDSPATLPVVISIEPDSTEAINSLPALPVVISAEMNNVGAINSPSTLPGENSTEPDSQA